MYDSTNIDFSVFFLKRRRRVACYTSFFLVESNQEFFINYFFHPRARWIFRFDWELIFETLDEFFKVSSLIKCLLFDHRLSKEYTSIENYSCFLFFLEFNLLFADTPPFSLSRRIYLMSKWFSYHISLLKCVKSVSILSTFEFRIIWPFLPLVCYEHNHMFFIVCTLQSRISFTIIYIYIYKFWMNVLFIDSVYCW